MAIFLQHTTPRITGSKKQSDEGAALFAVRVHAIVCARHGRELMGLKSPVCDPVLSLLLNIKY